MKNSVTPRAGVWIEIVKGCVWVCADGVTPRAGVWIEMSTSYTKTQRPLVTPRAGVWIEIMEPRGMSQSRTSLPVRECGLKWNVRHYQH